MFGRSSIFRDDSNMMSDHSTDSFHMPSLSTPSRRRQISEGSQRGRRDPLEQIFSDVNTTFSRMQTDPNAECFTSIRTIAYTNDSNGTPKYYEATSECAEAPGGVRQTRKCVRDSATGVSKMEIGHHIYDRGHVIERSQNRKNEGVIEKQDFLNMDEEDKDAFYKEWQNNVCHFAFKSNDGK